MKIENGKIVACTNIELYEYWLEQWSDIYSYTEYKARMLDLGVKINEEE